MPSTLTVGEGLGRIADDVGLVQRAGVDHRLDAVLGEDAVDQRPIGDRADHVGVRARRDVEADDLMALGAQARREETAEPAGRAGQQDAHG